MTDLRIERRITVLGAAALLLVPACARPAWQSAAAVFADPARVAATLGDPPSGDARDEADLPLLPAPHHERTCCAFGMDLQVDFAGMQVPFIDIGNVLGVDELGRHAYSLSDGAPEVETNGLVYTCRGGWIDLAHVREQADDLVFLALTLARTLEIGATVVIPGHGAPTTITVQALPPGLIAREGRLNAAARLAAWATYRISIWHEVSTWYGYQSVGGFSEQPSAFSPEDLYSNALGIRLGLAILDDRDFRSETNYDLAIESFIAEALRRLGAVPRETGRAIMTTLDGLWWDSTRRLPDDLLVVRRRFPSEGDEIAPWRASDAFDAHATPAVLETACADATVRPLVVPDRVGVVDARGLVSITWLPESWAGADFPFRDAATREVSEHDLDDLVESARAAMELVFGEGFDLPGTRAAPSPR